MTDAPAADAPAPASPPSDSLLTEATQPLDFSQGRPESFPEDFWDETNKSPNTAKLFDSYTQEKKRAEGLRAKLSRGEFEGKPPEDIKEYKLELTDDLKALVPEDDRMYNAARQAAKDAGLPKEAFNKFMKPIVEELAKVHAEMQPNEEMIESERAEYKRTELAKLGPNGNGVVTAVKGYVDGLEANGTFSKEEADAARDMANNAAAVRVMNKFRMMTGGQNQVPMDLPIDTAASISDVEKKMTAAGLKGDEAEFNRYSAQLMNMKKQAGMI